MLNYGHVPKNFHGTVEEVFGIFVNMEAGKIALEQAVTDIFTKWEDGEIVFTRKWRVQEQPDLDVFLVAQAPTEGIG